MLIYLFQYLIISKKYVLISKSEIDTAVKRISNFFRKAIYNDYVNEIAESSEIFLNLQIHWQDYGELKDNLIRINAFILTNGQYKGDIPCKSVHKWLYGLL